MQDIQSAPKTGKTVELQQQISNILPIRTNDRKLV